MRTIDWYYRGFLDYEDGAKKVEEFDTVLEGRAYHLGWCDAESDLAYVYRENEDEILERILRA